MVTHCGNNNVLWLCVVVSMTVVEDFLLHGGYVKNVVEQLYSIRMVCESLVSIPEDSVIPTTHDSNNGGVVPCKGVITGQYVSYTGNTGKM